MKLLNNETHYPLQWFDLKTTYKSLENLDIIKNYNNEFYPFAECRNDKEFSLDYEGDIVTPTKFNKELKDLKFVIY